MAEITMYKCDVCGKLQEEVLSITVENPFWLHDKTPKNEFEFSFTEPLHSRETGACSIECVRTVFDRWVAAKVKEHEAEIALASETESVPAPDQSLINAGGIPEAKEG